MHTFKKMLTRLRNDLEYLNMIKLHTIKPMCVIAKFNKLTLKYTAESAFVFTGRIFFGKKK